MTNSKSILRAVQLIDENIHWIHENKQAFFAHLDIYDWFRLEDVIFHGAYLTITYIDMKETRKKQQIPLFDYVAARRSLGT